MPVSLPTPSEDVGTWGTKLNAAIMEVEANAAGGLAVLNEDVMAVDDRVNRVDPGSIGAPRQRLSVVDGSPTWVDNPTLFAEDFRESGMDDDDVITAVLAAATQDDTIFFAPRTYTGDGTTHVIPSLVRIVGNGTKFEHVSWSPRSFAKIQYCEFMGEYAYVIRADGVAGGSSQAIEGVEIDHNRFSGIDRAIYVEHHNGGGSRSHEAWNIHDNDFGDATYGIFAFLPRRWRIRDNNLGGIDEHAILLIQSEDCKVTDNIIDGAKVGIGLMVFRASLGSLGIIRGNMISRNTIRNCTEEHIAIDVNGTTGVNIGVVEFDEVTSATSAAGGTQNHVVLSASGWSTSGFGDYYHYWVTFLDGALRAQSFKIQGNSAGTMIFFTDPTSDGHMTDAERASIVAGDHVSIGLPAIGNIITDNFIDAHGSVSTGHGTKSGIILWGNCFGNTVIGNRVQGGNIEVYTIQGLAKPTPSYTGNFGVAASLGNVVQGNPIEHGNLLWGFVDYDTGSGLPDGSGTPLLTFEGNISGPNPIVGGQVMVQHQSVQVPTYTTLS